MPNSIAVDLRQVSYVYPNGLRAGLRALAPIDLRIDRGEFVSIIGPSGCGKSTILRLVAGLLSPPREAQLSIWPDAPAGANPLAYVFQSPTLMPWANVERNVRLPLELSGEQRESAAARVEHVLRMVGLQDFRAAYPRELSGGMQMRVSIARALVTQPSLLLMDEPFAALDEISRSNLDGELSELWAAKLATEALTVLFVTHSIYEAVFLSTRIVVMSARPGRIIGELVIDEPHPRTDAFRSSERFARYCAAARRLLNIGMSESVVA